MMKYQEIGGRNDTEYTCDICGLREYDSDSEQERGYIEMYRDETGLDLCCYCMKERQKHGEYQEIVEELEQKDDQSIKTTKYIIVVYEYDKFIKSIVGEGRPLCSSDCWAKMWDKFHPENEENMLFGKKVKLEEVPNMIVCSCCGKGLR